ncbi:MAG: hypothetical protein J5I98_33040, partial [Phaeodactylibacter sp.]|nr:hypothetical protein [Phaeodactylibacter sp.]
MQPGARIVVKNGRELILTLCELTGCGNMWRGIEVEEGGALAMKAYNYLADAQYAVYAHAAAPEPVPYIAVEGNTFAGNFVGIYMGGPGKVDAFIAGNGFYGAESLLPPFAGQSAAPQGLPEQNGYSLAGIYVDEARTPFSYPQNIFSGLASGIVLLNTSGIVSRSSFDGMNAHMDAYPDYSFAGCGLCRQSETGGMLAAVDNNFSNCDWGMANGGGALAAT